MIICFLCLSTQTYAYTHKLTNLGIRILFIVQLDRIYWAVMAKYYQDSTENKELYKQKSMNKCMDGLSEWVNSLLAHVAYKCIGIPDMCTNWSLKL